jgi:coenzyme F420-reducing hydrogenase delta subunit
MELCGFEGERFGTHWGASAKAPELVAAIKEFVGTLKAVGPSPLRRKRGRKTPRELIGVSM